MPKPALQADHIAASTHRDVTLTPGPLVWPIQRLDLRLLPIGETRFVDHRQVLRCQMDVLRSVVAGRVAQLLLQGNGVATAD